MVIGYREESFREADATLFSIPMIPLRNGRSIQTQLVNTPDLKTKIV